MEREEWVPMTSADATEIMDPMKISSYHYYSAREV
jgi:hypothetical protein